MKNSSILGTGQQQTTAWPSLSLLLVKVTPGGKIRANKKKTPSIVVHIASAGEEKNGFSTHYYLPSIAPDAHFLVGVAGVAVFVPICHSRFAFALDALLGLDFSRALFTPPRKTGHGNASTH